MMTKRKKMMFRRSLFAHILLILPCWALRVYATRGRTPCPGWMCWIPAFLSTLHSTLTRPISSTSWTYQRHPQPSSVSQSQIHRNRPKWMSPLCSICRWELRPTPSVFIRICLKARTVSAKPNLSGESKLIQNYIVLRHVWKSAYADHGHITQRAKSALSSKR